MMTDQMDGLTDQDLQAMPDEDLLAMTTGLIYDAALMNGSPWADQCHARCDRAYDECKRRGRGIYQRAWNGAVRLGGQPQIAQRVDPKGV